MSITKLTKYLLFMQEIEAAAADQSEEGAIMKPATVIKPLHKIISEHKDVLKIVIQLNSIISTFKSDIQEVLELFSQYGHLWEKVSLLHGPLMLAVKANIYGLLYKQSSSVAFDETSSYWSALKSS